MGQVTLTGRKKITTKENFNSPNGLHFAIQATIIKSHSRNLLNLGLRRVRREGKSTLTSLMEEPGISEEERCRFWLLNGADSNSETDFNHETIN